MAETRKTPPTYVRSRDAEDGFPQVMPELWDRPGIQFTASDRGKPFRRAVIPDALLSVQNPPLAPEWHQVRVTEGTNLVTGNLRYVRESTLPPEVVLGLPVQDLRSVVDKIRRNPSAFQYEGPSLFTVMKSGASVSLGFAPDLASGLTRQACADAKLQTLPHATHIRKDGRPVTSVPPMR